MGMSVGAAMTRMLGHVRGVRGHGLYRIAAWDRTPFGEGLTLRCPAGCRWTMVHLADYEAGWARADLDAEVGAMIKHVLTHLDDPEMRERLHRTVAEATRAHEELAR